jgi:hypothetical protein
MVVVPLNSKLVIRNLTHGITPEQAYDVLPRQDKAKQPAGHFSVGSKQKPAGNSPGHGYHKTGYSKRYWMQIRPGKGATER